MNTQDHLEHCAANDHKHDGIVKPCDCAPYRKITPICTYCGSEREQHRLWCDKCLQMNLKDAGELLKVCQLQHRGAGGAAICICGASCGGSGACRGLSLLKSALSSNTSSYRDAVASLFGWS